MIARPLLIASVALFGFRATVQAQDHRPRHGFWFDFGLGYGAAAFSCHTCDAGPPVGGWAISGGLGWTVNPHLLVGAEGNFWMHGWKGPRLPVIEGWNVLVSYYPRQGRLFVDVGFGRRDYGLMTGTGDPLQTTSSTDPVYRSGAGWAFKAGLGWRWVRLTCVYTNIGKLRDPGGVTAGTIGW